MNPVEVGQPKYASARPPLRDRASGSRQGRRLATSRARSAQGGESNPSRLWEPKLLSDHPQPESNRPAARTGATPHPGAKSRRGTAATRHMGYAAWRSQVNQIPKDVTFSWVASRRISGIPSGPLSGPVARPSPSAYTSPVFSEPVLIEVPGHPALSATVPVEPDDTDRAVALRLAPAWPPGTVLTIADSKWVVGRQQPPAVSPVEVGATGCPPIGAEPSEAVLEPRQRKASGSRLKAVGNAAVPDEEKTG